MFLAFRERYEPDKAWSRQGRSLNAGNYEHLVMGHGVYLEAMWCTLDNKMQAKLTSAFVLLIKSEGSI